MKNLLIEVLQWLWNNQYRRASFERIIGIVPSAATEQQLAELVEEYPGLFRNCVIKGGLPGLALHDDVNVATALATVTGQVPAMQDPPLLVPDAVPTQSTEIPRVREADIEAEIQGVFYLNAYEALIASGTPAAYVPESMKLMTLCLASLRNGFTIVGKAACVSPDLYSREVGESLARADVIKQLWPLMGFRLADQLAA